MIFSVHLDSLGEHEYCVRVVENTGSPDAVVNGDELTRFDWTCKDSSGPKLAREARKVAEKKLKERGVA